VTRENAAIPQLAAAIDGDPATAVADARPAGT
jgi:hypothetical protein